MPIEIEFDPDVFHGELTANRAQVFVRAAQTADLADCTLHGFVHGPRCEHAHTLPAKFMLQDLGAGPTLLARATLTDPCLWTSDLPQIYDMHIELRRGSEVLAREQRMLGLRGIGTRISGSVAQLIRESKPWVPRGVALELMETVAVDELREQLLVGLCTSPPLDLLVEASRRGLYLIVQIDSQQQDVLATLRNLARWPAVMMAVIRNGGSLDPRLPQVAPNLVLAQRIIAAEIADFTPAPWAAALAWELTPGESTVPTEISKLPAGTGPVLVLAHFARQNLSPASSREECDRLQRRLATTGQFAGYFLAAASECSIA